MLDRLLGQPVRTRDGRRIGRVEEFRVRREGGGWIVEAYVLGVAGLFQRLHLGARLILGIQPRGYLARWDQVQIDRRGTLRLTCPLDELETYRDGEDGGNGW